MKTLEEFKNSTILKKTWLADVVDAPVPTAAELTLWNRTEGSRHSINKLNTVLNCICGNHPWPHGNVKLLKATGPEDKNSTVMTVAGPPRTGSTMVSNIINSFLPLMDPSDFGQWGVWKTHELFDSRCPMLMHQDFIFYCIRHPYDSFYSFLRVNDLSYDDVTDETGKITETHRNEIFADVSMAMVFSELYHNSTTKELLMPQVQRPLLVIPYEQYWKNEMKLIEDISNIINLNLTKDQKQDIFETINIKKAKQISHNLKAGTKDITSGLHHKHVGDESGAPSQGKHLPRYIKEDIMRHFGDVYKKFGYNLEP